MQGRASHSRLLPPWVPLCRWQDINQAYVRLPCVLDTPSKRRRKEVRLWQGQRHSCVLGAPRYANAALHWVFAQQR